MTWRKRSGIPISVVLDCSHFRLSSNGKRRARRQEDSRKKGGLRTRRETMGDISSDRVHHPMGLATFNDQEYIKPPALPCRDALVNQRAEAPKPCLSPAGMRKSTPAGGLLHAGSAFTNKAQGANFPSQLLPWSFQETIEGENIRKTTRQTFAKYNRSSHPKVIGTKSSQKSGFRPRWIVRLFVRLPILEGRRMLYRGGLYSGSVCYLVQ